MKVYIVMNALPWEHFGINVANPNPEGPPGRVQAASNEQLAGFLPIFWDQETAEKTFPGYTVQEADVADDWNPWLNARKAEQVGEVAPSEAPVEAAEAAPSEA